MSRTLRAEARIAAAQCGVRRGSVVRRDPGGRGPNSQPGRRGAHSPEGASGCQTPETDGAARRGGNKPRPGEKARSRAGGPVRSAARPAPLKLRLRIFFAEIRPSPAPLPRLRTQWGGRAEGPWSRPTPRRPSSASQWVTVTNRLVTATDRLVTATNRLVTATNGLTTLTNRRIAEPSRPTPRRPSCASRFAGEGHADESVGHGDESVGHGDESVGHGDE